MTQTFPAPSLLLADADHIKEFYGGFNGTCGETALAVALICALRLGYSHDQCVNLMLAITHAMQAKGWAGANGISYLWSLADEARDATDVNISDATVALEWDYAEPFPHDWHSILLANAGYKPIILQVGQAYNLVGQLGTGNDEPQVHYHFICVVGRCADGYIVADSDNWQVENEFAIYSYATLQAADICGLLVLDVVPASQGGSSMAVPAGWHDDGTTLTAPNGEKTEGYIRAHIIDHSPQWDAALQPVAPLYGVSGGWQQDFAASVSVFSSTSGACSDEAGPDYLAQIAALKAQLAAQQTKPTPASVTNALSTASQLLQPFAAAAADVTQAQKDMAANA